MVSILAEVVLPDVSGMIDDSVINTFAFVSDRATAAIAAAAIEPKLVDFYNLNTAGANTSVGSHLNQTRSRVANASLIRWYDIGGNLDGGPHGSPVRQGVFTLAAWDTTTALPSEICAVNSFHSNYGADLEEFGAIRPRARDRGRVYIGPLTSSCTTDDNNGHVTISTAFRTILTVASLGLQAGVEALAGGQDSWGVWSRAKSQINPVVGGHVDNALDIQRRRGVEATVRTMWP